ncbi:MAG: HEAT repeat domain-containing protein [Candidatus Heimdallarchaeaceae archaeon]
MSESTDSTDMHALIKQLKYSSIPLQRERAAYILANFRHSKALEALLNAQLQDPNPKVRDAASQALASLITSDDFDEGIVEELKAQDKDIDPRLGSDLFNLSKEFEIIRKGMKKERYNQNDSIELRQLFKSVDKDRYLKKQPNVKTLINSILLLPIDNPDMGRDVAIGIGEILRVSTEESERLTAIGCLNNIITNIDKYTPYFGIAEAYIMIFKASDEYEIRITAFKCLEELIVKKKSLAKLNQYTNDIVKLLKFSYDQKIREIALFAYPDLVLTKDDKIPYLVDVIIGVVRATYEDRLREMGLKALEAIIIRDYLSDLNVQRIIKILKSHHTKNVRIRAIELFTQLVFQSIPEIAETSVVVLVKVVLNTKEENICYTALQNIEKYTFMSIDTNLVLRILHTLGDITLKSYHPFLAFRAYNILESIILNNPDKFTEDFAETFIDCLKLHKDIGVIEQILLTYSALVTNRNLIPKDIKQYVKTILYVTTDPEILEGLVNIFKELMISDERVIPEKVVNKLMEIVSKTIVKDDIFLLLTQLEVEEFF